MDSVYITCRETTKSNLVASVNDLLDVLFSQKIIIVGNDTVWSILFKTAELLTRVNQIHAYLVHVDKEALRSLFDSILILAELIEQESERREILSSVALLIKNSNFLDFPQKAKLLVKAINMNLDRTQMKVILLESFLEVCYSNKEYNFPAGILLDILDVEPDYSLIFNWLGVYYFASRIADANDNLKGKSQMFRVKYLKCALGIKDKVLLKNNPAAYNEIHQVAKEAITHWFRNEKTISQSFVDVITKISNFVEKIDLLKTQKFYAELLQIFCEANFAKIYDLNAKIGDKAFFSREFSISFEYCLEKMRFISLEKLVQKSIEDGKSSISFKLIIAKMMLMFDEDAERLVIKAISRGYLKGVKVDQKKRGVVLKGDSAKMGKPLDEADRGKKTEKLDYLIAGLKELKIGLKSVCAIEDDSKKDEENCVFCEKRFL